MAFAVTFEKLCAGMGTSAFLALLMSLCNKRFTATQYALLSSLASLGRVFVGPSAGFIVEYAGWANFFLFAAIAAIPGLALLYHLKPEITGQKDDKGNTAGGNLAASHLLLPDFGREAPPRRVLGGDARVHEMEQVFLPAAFVPRPDILKPPKGWRPTSAPVMRLFR